MKTHCCTPVIEHELCLLSLVRLKTSQEPLSDNPNVGTKINNAKKADSGDKAMSRKRPRVGRMTKTDDEHNEKKAMISLTINVCDVEPI